MNLKIVDHGYSKGVTKRPRYTHSKDGIKCGLNNVRYDYCMLHSMPELFQLTDEVILSPKHGE